MFTKNIENYIYVYEEERDTRAHIYSIFILYISMWTHSLLYVSSLILVWAVLIAPFVQQDGWTPGTIFEVFAN